MWLLILLNTIGLISPTTPKIKVIFRIFEPIIFPNDIPTSFFDKATIVTKISGRDVPIATTVIPIAFSENPNCRTKGTAPLLIKSSEPQYRHILPANSLTSDGKMFPETWVPLLGSTSMLALKILPNIKTEKIRSRPNESPVDIILSKEIKYK